MIKLLYFAKVREELGLGSESIEWTEAISTVDTLKAHLVLKHKAELLTLNGISLLVAVNQTVVDASALISDGDEVAFYPPVTGG